MLSAINQRRLLGDEFWAFSGQILSVLAMLVGMRVLTELVSPAVFGQVALLNGFVALGVGVFSYPFICAGMRLLPECRNSRERTMLNTVVFGLTTKSVMLAITLLMLGGAFYCYFSGSQVGLFVLTGLLLLVTVRRELGIQLLIGERKLRDAGFWQTSDSVLRPAVAIWLVWGLGQSPEAVLLGYIVAGVVSNTIWVIVKGDREEKRSSNLALLGRQLKHNVWIYAWPLIPIELVFWVNGLADRYVIGYFLTAAEVGLYVATYLVVNEAFNRCSMLLLRVFQPVYFQAVSANSSKDALFVLRWWFISVLGTSLTGIFLVWLCQEWFASLLLAKSYHAAVELMPAIAIGASLRAIGTVATQPLLAKKQTRILLRGRVCGAMAVAVSLPLMIAQFGLIGAAWANPVYFGIEALVLALLARPGYVTQVAAVRENRSQDAGVGVVHFCFASIRKKAIFLSAES